MTNRFEPLKAPLRADPQALQSVPATPGGLIRSTLLAASAAGAILVLFWLPAEYGIDPTGVGRLTGLTEMGEIKEQLAAEAEADAQTAIAAPPALAPELVARLDRIEAQLAAIALAMETPSAEAPEAAAPLPVAESPPATPDWRDEVSYTLAPGEGIEVKLAMEAGQTARYAWTANGGVVNFDMHGDGSGQKISYEQGRAVPELAGELTAAFTGNHGWFWRNRSDAPVTVTLRTGGDYQELRAP
jgi:hypothetical protein